MSSLYGSKATYGYTAYGTDDTSQDTGVDKNTGTGASDGKPADPYNVCRFNHDRIDGTTATYDMGFRDYAPDLNSFLIRDMYTGALADTAMTTDPYTGNRYTFAGGNPLTNIELDGHQYNYDTGHPGEPAAGQPGAQGEPGSRQEIQKVQNALDVTACRVQGGCGGSKNVLKGRSRNDSAVKAFLKYGSDCYPGQVVCHVQMEMLKQGFSPKLADRFGGDYCRYIHCNSTGDAMVTGRLIG